LSQAAQVVVITIPTITLHPEDANAAIGTTPGLVSRATGNGALTLTWETSSNGTTWTEIQNAQTIELSTLFEQYNTNHRKWFKDVHGTWCFINPQGTLTRNGTQIKLGTKYWTNPNLLIGASILVLKNVQTNHSGQFRMKASNAAGSKTSNPALLTVGGPGPGGFGGGGSGGYG